MDKEPSFPTSAVTVCLRESDKIYQVGEGVELAGDRVLIIHEGVSFDEASPVIAVHFVEAPDSTAVIVVKHDGELGAVFRKDFAAELRKVSILRGGSDELRGRPTATGALYQCECGQQQYVGRVGSKAPTCSRDGKPMKRVP